MWFGGWEGEQGEGKEGYRQLICKGLGCGVVYVADGGCSCMRTWEYNYVSICGPRGCRRR